MNTDSPKFSWDKTDLPYQGRVFIPSEYVGTHRISPEDNARNLIQFKNVRILERYDCLDAYDTHARATYICMGLGYISVDLYFKRENLVKVYNINILK